MPESTHSDRFEQDLQSIHIQLANELGVTYLELTITNHLGQPSEPGACLLKVTVSNYLQSNYKRQLLSKTKNFAKLIITNYAKLLVYSSYNFNKADWHNLNRFIALKNGDAHFYSANTETSSVSCHGHLHYNTDPSGSLWNHNAILQNTISTT